MDIVTHGLTGCLVARAVTGHMSWPVAAAAVAGALAPDLDALAGAWNPLAPITVHRTATHSFVGGLPLALAVAGTLRLASSSLSFGLLAIVAYLGVLSHIGLDLLTPYGTAVLWPLDARRLSLGWLYVIDPVVTGAVLTGLLLMRRARHPRRVAHVALAAVTAYALVAGAMGWWARVEFGRRLAAEGLARARLVVVPVFPGPLRWLGVAETEETVHLARFWLGAQSPQLLTPLRRPIAEVPSGVDGLAEVRAFRAFARVPWRTLIADEDGQIVEYRDLAFEDHPWGGPMALRVRLDRAGFVRAVELGHKL